MIKCRLLCRTGRIWFMALPLTGIVGSWVSYFISLSPHFLRCRIEISISTL